jgi:hypothetical protein
MSTQLFKSTLQQKHADDREEDWTKMMGLIDIQAKFSPHPVRIQLDSLPAAGQETIQAQVLAVAEAE